jgi:beta-xylosidase
MVMLPDKRDYFMYHAYEAKENVYTGRQGLLDEIVWTDEGWPHFAGGRTPVAAAPSPFGKAQASSSPVDFVDSFDAPKRNVAWQWDLQHPPKFSIADGALQLGVSDASEPSPVGTFFGVRVQKGDYALSATIDKGGPAREGIAVYGEAKSALALRVEDEGLVVTKVEKGQAKKLATAALPEGEKLQLRMTVREGHKYRFHASADGKDWKPIGEQEIDGAFIPPWDRAPRVGLVVDGKAGDTGKFEAMELLYQRP